MAQVQKHFKKRDAILDYLRSTSAHPSAETIFTDLKAQIPDLAIGTVYRNLTLFRQQRKISCIATVNGVERFDANTNPHVHFICTDCEAVIDLHGMHIPDSLTQTAESCSGGKVTECQLSFTGLCPTCNLLKESGETA